MMKPLDSPIISIIVVTSLLVYLWSIMPSLPLLLFLRDGIWLLLDLSVACLALSLGFPSWRPVVDICNWSSVPVCLEPSVYFCLCVPSCFVPLSFCLLNQPPFPCIICVVWLWYVFQSSVCSSVEVFFFHVCHIRFIVTGFCIVLPLLNPFSFFALSTSSLFGFDGFGNLLFHVANGYPLKSLNHYVCHMVAALFSFCL